MSSNFMSTISSFESISQYYNGLAPDCSDVMFGTDLPGTQYYVPGGANYCSLMATYNLKDGQEQEADKLAAYAKLYNGNMTLLNRSVQEPSLVSREGTNIIDILFQHPQCTRFAQIVSKANWQGYLYQSPYVSMFVPINKAVPHFEELIQLPPTTMLRNLAKAHTMNFVLDPTSLVGRKTSVLTVLPGYSPVVDGTNKDRMTIYEIDYTPRDGVMYPKLVKKGNILQQYVADNGSIFLIDTMLEPNTIV